MVSFRVNLSIYKYFIFYIRHSFILSLYYFNEKVYLRACLYINTGNYTYVIFLFL